MPLVKLPNRSKLYEATTLLTAVAVGYEKADLVLRNGTVIDVNTGDLLEGFCVVVKGDRIAYVGRNVDDKIGGNTRVIDLKGSYVAPGLIDGHVHIESSMLTPSRFTELVIPRGETSVFIDPHEIANVLGMEGVKLFIMEASILPLKIFITFPSCVPSAPGLETSGAIFTSEDVARAMELDEVVGLAEVMNFPGVLSLDKDVHMEISMTLRSGKVVEGHAPSLSYEDLAGYVAAGISSCHESCSGEEAYNKLLLGMYTMLRESSVSRNLHNTLSFLIGKDVDLRHVILVTDDREARDLRDFGGVDYVVRRAIEEGVDPIDAIRMATINVAEHYEMGRELGAIAPARFADIIVFDDLEKLDIHMVIADGRIVAKDSSLLVNIPRFEYPEYCLRSVKLRRRLTESSLGIHVDVDRGYARVRVLDVGGGLYIEEKDVDLPVVDGFIRSDLDNDVLHAAVVERHGKNGNVGRGFVSGFGFVRGAAASTVSHDCHNIVVVGTNFRDMLYAVEALEEVGGGIVVVDESNIIGFVKLPVAGLMSYEDPDTLIKEVEEVERAFKYIGSKMDSPFMVMSFLALAVIPEIRLTDMGLVDVRKSRLVDVVLGVKAI